MAQFACTCPFNARVKKEEQKATARLFVIVKHLLQSVTACNAKVRYNLVWQRGHREEIYSQAFPPLQCPRTRLALWPTSNSWPTCAVS